MRIASHGMIEHALRMSTAKRRIRALECRMEFGGELRFQARMVQNIVPTFRILEA